MALIVLSLRECIVTTGTVSSTGTLAGWFVMVKDNVGRFPGNKLWGDGWVGPGYYPWPLPLDVERPFYRWNISSKETNDRGENYHEGNRGNEPGSGNSRD
ncbi:hypothetical protein [Bradyrhizobium sp. USDA 10063]